MNSTDILYYLLLDLFQLEATPSNQVCKNRVSMLLEELGAKIKNNKPPNVQDVMIKLEKYAAELERSHTEAN